MKMAMRGRALPGLLVLAAMGQSFDWTVGNKVVSTSEYTHENCGAGMYAQMAIIESPTTGKTHVRTACLSCPAGKYQSSTGTMWHHMCFACPPGKFQPEKATTHCTECADGTFQPLGAQIASSACRGCPSGKYSQEDRSECNDLTPGPTAAPTAAPTTRCFPGQYHKKTFSNELNVFTYECQECPTGRFQPHHTVLSTCFACTVGLYSAKTGSTFCTKCESGRFSGINGQSKCKDCPTGLYSNFLRDQCTANPVCPPGKYTLTGFTPHTCEKCGRGKYQDTYGQLECKKCQSPLYMPFEGASKCTECPVGRFSIGSGMWMCVKKLPAGSKPLIVLHHGGLVLPEGPYTGTNGNYLNQPTSFPTAAPTKVSQYSLEPTKDPTPRPTVEVCGVGHYMVDPTAVSASDVLHPRVGRTHVSARGAFLCVGCPSGKYVDARGYGKCFHCPLGKFQPEKGQGFCDVCPPGQASDLMRIACEDTTAPTVAPTAAPSKLPTAAPTHTPTIAPTPAPTKSLPVDNTCEAGYYLNSQYECVICSAGRFTADNENTFSACQMCTPGKYQTDTGATSCDFCPDGKFQDAAGGSDCRLCSQFDDSPGTNVGPGTCPKQCSVGQHVQVVKQGHGLPAVKACYSCPSGMYGQASAGGEAVCASCPAGYSALQYGEQACTACAVDSFQDSAAQAECKQCPMGYHQPVLGRVSCVITSAPTLAPTKFLTPAPTAQPTPNYDSESNVRLTQGLPVSAVHAIHLEMTMVDHSGTVARCKGGSKWSNCGSFCTATCADPFPYCSDLSCHARCECEVGFVWSADQCVVRSQCGSGSDLGI